MNSNKKIDKRFFLRALWRQWHTYMAIFIFHVLHDNKRFKNTLALIVDKGWNLFEWVNFFKFFRLKIWISDHSAVNQIFKPFQSQPKSNSCCVVRMLHIKENRFLRCFVIITDNGSCFDWFPWRSISWCAWIFKGSMEDKSWSVFLFVEDFEYQALIFFLLRIIVPFMVVVWLKRISFSCSLWISQFICDMFFWVYCISVTYSQGLDVNWVIGDRSPNIDERISTFHVLFHIFRS